jgi:hypothetical protein
MSLMAVETACMQPIATLQEKYSDGMNIMQWAARFTPFNRKELALPLLRRQLASHRVQWSNRHVTTFANPSFQPGCRSREGTDH